MAFWKSVGWTPRSDLSLISKNIETVAAADVGRLRAGC